MKFKSYDGYELKGTMLSAEGEKGALLFVHGITSSKDELGFHSDYATYLGANGISSLRFDYRFHGVNAASLEHLSLCGIVNDIDAAYKALRSSVSSGVKSFFIVGTSFGGGLAAFWADYCNREEIKKVILNAPVIDYEDDVLRRNGLLGEDLLSDKAQKQLKKKGFVNSSGIHFGRELVNELRYINGIIPIERLGNKVVIFHGNNDEDVPLASSQKYKARNTELIVIDGVGHGFGIDIDEDLTHPETKKIHNHIYSQALTIIKNSI